MTTTGLNHINLHAKRDLLDALKDFYCEVVGLRVGPRPAFRNFGYWLYAGEKPVVHLWEADPEELRRTDVATTFDHVAFDCANSADIEAILRRRGVSYRTAPVPDSRRFQIFLKDPAGNGVELNFENADA
jgi:catechol-2,3-dioxygenase